jgi:hypothetical protein
MYRYNCVVEHLIIHRKSHREIAPTGARVGLADQHLVARRSRPDIVKSGATGVR